MATWVIYLLIATAVYAFIFIWNKMNKPKRLKALNNYYEKNRKEFPWLDNWLKQNPNVAEKRIESEKGTDILIFILLYVIVALIILIFRKWSFIHFLLIAGSVIFFFLHKWMKKDATYGGLEFELECPSCHCPHAWVMTRKETIRSGSSTSTSTTVSGTRSTEGGITGFGMNSHLSNFDKSKTTSKTTYYYDIIKDFKCLNCGHIGRKEHNNLETSYPPAPGVEVFDPPKQSWKPKPPKISKSSLAPGEQILKYDDGTYAGKVVKGKHHGKGKFIWNNGDVYEGDWVHGKRIGKGKITWINGDVYEGDFANSAENGKGKLTLTDGTIYEGDFVNDKYHGKGKLTDSYGVYEGDWIKGKQQGKGKMTWSNGNSYEGDWVNGRPNGTGKATYTDGKVEDGNWEDGKFAG